MMITSEKATQKSITCSRLSVHQESFLWTLCQELVLSSWTACMRPCSSSRKPFGIAKRDPSLREATGPEHHRRVTRYCFAEADVDRLLALYNDLEVMRFINGGKPTSREEVEREYRERFAGDGYWAAVEK